MTDEDRLRQLESTLRALQPPPLSPATIQTLSHALASPRLSLPDRILSATLSLATLAACLIVTLLLYFATLSPSSSPPQPTGSQAIPTLANPEPLLTRADFHHPE